MFHLHYGRMRPRAGQSSALSGSLALDRRWREARVLGAGTAASLPAATYLKPNGTDFLTITDSLSGTMTIDVSGIDFANRNDDVPLFKVGKASILPARGDVVISGELPAPWRLAKTPYGLGGRACNWFWICRRGVVG